MSNMLYACSILYKTKLPMIMVFNKTDVKDASFAQRWMTDYDALQEALRLDDESGMFGGWEGRDADQGEGGMAVSGGSGYMGSLLNSMSMVLEEFYAHLSVVAVSARVGTGMDEFFDAVKEKAEEFKRDYQPELERRRQERDEMKTQMRAKELQKMMQGMSVDPTTAKVKAPTIDDDFDIDAASDGVEDDDVEDDEEDRDGLQARYAAATADNDDSVMGDASFAKYLHMPRG
jgi:GPN-loop GTPase